MNRMDIHAVIHGYAASLPDPVIDFYKARKDRSFREKLITLETGLLECPAHLPEQHYFKYLFLGLCHYYLQKPSYVSYLKRATTTGLFPELLPMVMSLVHEQTIAERILVIISFDPEENIRFEDLRSIHTNITVVVAADDFDPIAMLKSWGTYDQVFIAGHGEHKSETYEGHVRLGRKLLKPGMIADTVMADAALPTVLGIFTCGEAFYSMEARDHFDFFITDHQSSVTSFVEMFLYGYLIDYSRYHNIPHAFQAGRRATIFQAKSDPTFKIFARGVKLQE